MYRARNIHYEHSDRVRGLASGGIGAMHQLAQHVGLVAAIDRQVEVLKGHLPYHESDHVLGIAYNVRSPRPTRCAAAGDASPRSRHSRSPRTRSLCA